MMNAAASDGNELFATCGKRSADARLGSVPNHAVFNPQKVILRSLVAWGCVTAAGKRAFLV
jgi:hypothetical protein